MAEERSPMRSKFEGIAEIGMPFGPSASVTPPAGRRRPLQITGFAARGISCLSTTRIGDIGHTAQPPKAGISIAGERREFLDGRISHLSMMDERERRHYSVHFGARRGKAVSW
jgi:hypothetical protein